MNHIEYQLKKADDFTNQGKFLHAIQIYQNVIDADNSYTLAYVRLADLYTRIDKFESAVNLLVNYVNNFPEDQEVKLFLGQIYLKNKMWNEAIEIPSLVFPEEHSIVSFLLGFAYFNIKEPELAKMNFMSFLRHENNSEFTLQAYIFLSRIELDTDNPDAAHSFLVNAEAIYSNNWEVHLLFGIYYFKKGMYYHSVNSLKKAIKLNPDEKEVYFWAGKAYFKSGDYIMAEKSFLECVINNDATSETYSYLGLTCLNANKKADANNYFDLALNLDPNNEIALEGKRKCEM